MEVFVGGHIALPRGLITSDNAYYQVPADIAENGIIDNTTLPLRTPTAQ